MAQYLFEVQQKSRLSQKGLLKRFVPKCIGIQETLESIRAKKSARFIELRKKRGTREFEEVFLKYVPADLQKKDDKELSKEKTPEKSVKEEEETSNNKTRKKKMTNNALRKFLFPI